MFVSEEDDCTYNFNFPTQLACHDSDAVGCTIYDNDKLYDLTSLLRTGSETNWQATGFDDDGQPVRIYVNVCGGLTQTGLVKGRCGQEDGACSVIRTDDNGYVGTSLGHPLAPRIEKGTVILDYTKHADSTCVTARVLMRCDAAGHVSTPKFEGYVANEEAGTTDCLADDSMALITWTTSAACPVQESEGGNCKVTDPKTNFEFDFASLKQVRFVSHRARSPSLAAHPPA